MGNQEYQENQENEKYQKEYQEKQKKKKMSSGAFLSLIFFSVVVGLVMYNNDQKRQEKYDAAYESIKFTQDMQQNTMGFIDSENATLHYNVPNGYVYSKENSTDNSKMYIAEDYSRVFCVSFGETDKKYTKLDIDLLVSNDLAAGYTESVESYRNYDFYVYSYSENTEWDNNGIKPVSVCTYLCVQDRYMICVDDILYSEENNPQDVSNLLNSLYFYETSKN